MAHRGQHHNLSWFILGIALCLAEAEEGSATAYNRTAPVRDVYTTTRYPDYTTTPYPYYTTTEVPNPCPLAFQVIGDRCVLVEPLIVGTWEEIRYFCLDIGTHMVEVDKAEFFHDLLRFIRLFGMDTKGYWIGGSDRTEEGVWRWESGMEVPTKSPFWAFKCRTSYCNNNDDNYVMEPSNETNEDCLCMDQTRFLYFDDADCNHQKSAICQIPIDRKKE